MFSLKKIPLALLAVLSLSSCKFFGDIFPPPQQTKPSYVAVENNSGRIIYSNNSVGERPIGMLTNVMTAAVAVDWIRSQNIDASSLLSVPNEVLKWPHTNLLQLRPGDKISVRDALYSALLSDDSGSAITLAYACGSTLNPSNPSGAFLEEMRNLATNLGMKQTSFRDVHGANTSYSTARDLALLAIYAHQNPAFQLIAAQKQNVCTVYNADGTSRQITVKNSNRLLQERQDVDGIKVALSKKAGACLMITSRRPSIRRPYGRDGEMLTYPQSMSIIILGTTPEQRYVWASKFLNEGWSEWEKWLQNQLPYDATRFISIPK